jgi:hypothetical protein
MTIEKSAAFTLIVVSVPDFTLILPSYSGAAYAGQVFPISAEVESVDQFAGDIVFSIAGQPPGSVVTFLPSDTVTIAPGFKKGVQINIAIPADNSLAGTYIILITAISTVYNGQ